MSIHMLSDRFTSKVQPCQFTGCWIWMASTNRGYGQYYLDGRVVKAHRLAYESKYGDIPSELVIDHLCRNPSCVNPDHLEAVTQLVNVRRGLVGGVQRAVTHCPQGHAYQGYNLYIKRNGHRQCKTCINASGRRSRARKRKK